MFCEKCGAPLNPGETACSACGAPVSGPVNPASGPVNPVSAPVAPPVAPADPYVNIPNANPMPYGAPNGAQTQYMSPWAYVGYNLLFSIPIVGIILMIVFACDQTYINRRNYARSFLITLLIGVVLAIFVVVVADVSFGSLSRSARYY